MSEFQTRQQRREAERTGGRPPTGPRLVGLDGQPLGGPNPLDTIPDHSICPLMTTFVAPVVPDPTTRSITVRGGPGFFPCIHQKCAFWAPEAAVDARVQEGCTILRFMRGVAPVVEHLDACAEDLVSAAAEAGLIDDADAPDAGDAKPEPAAEPEVYGA